MSRYSFFLLVLVCVVLTCFVILGVWGNAPDNSQISVELTAGDTPADSPVVTGFEPVSHPSASPELLNQGPSWADEIAIQLQALLTDNRLGAAVKLINDNYRQANAADLEQFKLVILQHAEQLVGKGDHAHASTLLESYAQAFDDVDAWRMLASSFGNLKDWDNAVIASLRWSRLEYRPDVYQAALSTLVKSASYVRASLERQSDEPGILALYQSLYEQHPDYARIQLELAQSHLRLGNPEAAKPYLEILQYDADLGSLARQKLAALSASQSEQQIAEAELATLQSNQRNSTDIVVPLIRNGNSLLINVSINSRPLLMLLDTGASITAFSTATIERLNLQATGRYVQLGTANGTRRSQLYRAAKIRLGRMIVENIMVAEVDMKQGNGAQGLLGTDVLNQLDDHYGYVIDNQKNALIFNRK